MKKILIILLIAVLAASILVAGIGCKEEVGDVEEEVAEETTEEEMAEETTEEEMAEIRLGYISKMLTHPWYIAEYDGFEKKAIELGATSVSADGNLNDEDLLDAVNNLNDKTDAVARKVDSEAAGLAFEIPSCALEFIHASYIDDLWEQTSLEIFKTAVNNANDMSQVNGTLRFGYSQDTNVEPGLIYDKNAILDLDDSYLVGHETHPFVIDMSNYHNYVYDRADAALASTDDLIIRHHTNELIENLQAHGAPVYASTRGRVQTILNALNMLKLRRLVVESEGIYRVTPGELDILNYYANSIIHWQQPKQ